jgi:hypothetical protein
VALSRSKSRNLGTIACLVFAALSLAFGYSIGSQVKYFESAGLRAEALVVGIHRGAKSSKFAIVAFSTAEGRPVEARCAFQMFTIRNETGDAVTVLYDPSDPQSVMIDNGLWNWDQPLFGVLGGVLLLGLALVFLIEPSASNRV